jgi:hypothetical protein
MMANGIAPSSDMKKAVECLGFGGSRKPFV